jgi:hypothetical protein
VSFAWTLSSRAMPNCTPQQPVPATNTRSA